ncbi:unnamed protein product [Allacma fusca]|uniref:Ionotropic glutamate receptor L-glutamate and glycine-binding domain-containing protein n=1 Tax=Allacma fusca TaxID=39272 RepID=A0A8J2NSE2_9HEXA|nr:unnamed protein product [Allacma fusca]
MLLSNTGLRIYVKLDQTCARNYPSMENPYYSLTLDGEPFPDYTTWQKITKTTGLSCSTIVVTCFTFKTCRIPDSLILYKMLVANGILLRERRSLLYIEKPNYDNTTVPNFTSYQSQDVENYTVPVMNEAKRILKELKSHITYIHELTGNYHRRNGQKIPDGLYETVTFTPNWFPGGTPVLKSTWSLQHGFIFPPNVNVDLTLARPEGIATFCVSNKHIPPSIDISANGDIHGLDGELIKIFQRRFNFRLKFVEPRDKDFGSKEATGEWSGVIGYIIRKEADFGLGQITFTHERFETGLKFSQSLLVLTGVAVCPLPRLLPSYKILTYPFDESTWIGVVGASIFVITTLEIVQRIVCRVFGIKFNVGRKTIFLKLRRQRMVPWIQSVGSVFLRSVSIQALPRRWGILGLFSVWLIFTFIVNVYYTTILIGELTVFPREAYVISPFDLLKSQNMWALSPIVNQTLTNSSHLTERLLLKGANPILDSEYNEGPPDTKVYSYVNATGNCGLAESTRSKYYLSTNFTIRQRNSDHTKVYLSRDSFLIGPTVQIIRIYNQNLGKLEQTRT